MSNGLLEYLLIFVNINEYKHSCSSLVYINSGPLIYTTFDFSKCLN